MEGKRVEAFSEADEKKLPPPRDFFARELAYVIEKSGRCTENDSKEALQLYLEGACSLPLAVAFAERSTEHSALLWEMLVSYSLDPSNETNAAIGNSPTKCHSGTLFGGLLEAAAQSGADLAHLVFQIPEGMRIKGLRPMLVAAVADYRLKVKMHEIACDTFVDDKTSMLRELTHRARRAARVVGAVSSFELDAYRSSLKDQTTPSYVVSNDDTRSQHPNEFKCVLKHKSRNLEQRQLRMRLSKAIPLR